jgi:hypothetical protein
VLHGSDEFPSNKFPSSRKKNWECVKGKRKGWKSASQLGKTLIFGHDKKLPCPEFREKLERNEARRSAENIGNAS